MHTSTSLYEAEWEPLCVWRVDTHGEDSRLYLHLGRDMTVMLTPRELGRLVTALLLAMDASVELAGPQ